MDIIDIFKDIAPEFSNEDSAKITRFIDYSTAEVGVDIFTSKEADINYKKAIAYLSASKMKIAKSSTGSSIGGVYTNIKAGNLEKSYTGAGSNLAKSLTDNFYQEQFQSIIDKYNANRVILFSSL